MIVCKKCGNEMPDGAKFCSKCGESLNDISAGTKDIIISAKNGDPEAFGKLYELYRKSGISIAKQYVKNDTDAEDMYQDAFLKAMENIDRFDENREFGPWLNTIIANTCKDFLGKKRPMNFTDMSDEENEFVDTIASTDESSLPESMYVRKEMLQIVDGIVEMLPEEQKEATLLFYFKDYSVKQVAEYQHVSEDTVKSRLNYSRKKIEQATKEYEKKHGIKICVSSVIPAILVLYFKNSVHASQLDASLGALSASNGLSGAGAGAKLGSGAIKAGTAGKTVAAAKTVAAWKIAAIAGAGIIAAAGVGFAVHHFVTSDDRDETVAEESENELEESEAQEDVRIQESETQEEPVAEEEKNSWGYINEEGYYVFGSYEQDGNEANGPEPIEWEILDQNENGTLLVSRYVLDCVQYNTDDTCQYNNPDTYVTWETCSLRSWMNDDFYNTAFSDEEKSLINMVDVVNEDNPDYGTEAGNNTSDRLFALSISEIIRYYDINPWYTKDNRYYSRSNDTIGSYGVGYSEALITPVTNYAQSRGAVTYTITPTHYEQILFPHNYSENCIGSIGGYWWLRTPGHHNGVSGVDYDGMAGGYNNRRVNDSGMGVRPALYINVGTQEKPVVEEEKSSIGYINDEGYYVFGSYEQDGNEANGPEPIEWVIVDKNDKGTLLMSRYVLDCVQYNTERMEVSWATCSLRSWMNNDFYNAAFNDEEKASINTVDTGRYNGTKVSDKVFAPSVGDIKYNYLWDIWWADTYPGDYLAPLIAPPTKYAESRGVSTNAVINDDYWLSGEQYSADWWLRSLMIPTADTYDMACVFTSDHSQGRSYERVVDWDDIGVRPALYINTLLDIHND
jgi:RNA polymerase sigma factor (sigma-70 family)